MNIDRVTAKKKSVLGYFGSRRAREGLKRVENGHFEAVMSRLSKDT